MSRRRQKREKRSEAALAGEFGELNRLTAEGFLRLREKLSFISELENASEGAVRIRLPITHTVSGLPTGDDHE